MIRFVVDAFSIGAADENTQNTDLFQVYLKKQKQVAVSSPILSGKQNLSIVPLRHNQVSHTTSHQ